MLDFRDLGNLKGNDFTVEEKRSCEVIGCMKREGYQEEKDILRVIF